MVFLSFIAGEPFEALLKISNAYVDMKFDAESLKVKSIKTPHSLCTAFLEGRKSIAITDNLKEQGRKYTYEFDLEEERRILVGLLKRGLIHDGYKEIIGHEPRIPFLQRLHI